MPFQFRPAKREQVGLLIGVAGASGAGKSYSAMRLATGIAGDKPFAVIDTEAGRAKHYADIFKFDHGDMAPPFSPDRYMEAIHAADAAGYPAIVIDSFSHEWSGDGGCCEMQEAELDRMAGDDWRKREACKFGAWAPAKKAHKKLVSRLLQCRAHLIFAFRAEPKVEMRRSADGKMEVVPKRLLGWSSEWIPITEKGFLFEMTASFVLSPDRPGCPIPIKLQEQHRPFFPLDQPITEESGRRLAAWAKGGAAPTPATTPASPPPDERTAILQEIKAVIMAYFPGTADRDKAARVKVARRVWDVGAWAEIEKLPVERLRMGMEKPDLATPSRLEAACVDFKAELSAA
jgi:AAA domain-containing protein